VSRLNDQLSGRIGAVAGAAVTAAQPLSGGDINEAYALRLADGRRLFLKTNARPPAGMFPAEARGLQWLAEAGAPLRLPAVVAAEEEFLLLELIAEGRSPRRGGSFDEDLGRGLAALHRRSPAGFGLDHDNFIGRLPQANRPAATWAAFFVRERLEPQLRRATDAGKLPPGVARGLDQVMTRMDQLVGPAEPPARLHGDLWGGNVMSDENGTPCLIDPAVYGGHREVDLAMMRLFGGFSARTFAAYEESFATAPGHDERVPLYQLYPLLVHVNLFGESYVTSVESALNLLL